MGRLSRRGFLQGSMAAGAGLALGGGLRWAPPAGAAIRQPGSLPDPSRPAGAPHPSLPFDHVVVVMMENHSFDNYFGMLPAKGRPAVDGFRFDDTGRPLDANPLPGGRQRAFHLEGTCQPNGVSQSWHASHQQIAGGRMDGFAATDPEAMGYWDDTDLPFYYSFAKAFCLGDRSFCSVAAQTYPNRRFLYAGTASGTISTDNSTFTMAAPTNGTVMDALTTAGVSWRSYFTDLPALGIIPSNIENHPASYFPITQFFADCASGTLPSVSYVDPEFGIVDVVGGELFKQLKAQPLLPASIQAGLATLHSTGGDEENTQDIAIGEAFVARVVQAVLDSPLWPRTLLVWTYDEHGGYYDHVVPPAAIRPDAIDPVLSASETYVDDRYDRLGIRVPTVVASPYSRPGGVTHVVHDHTSITATIAAKWNVPAQTFRDANATTLLDHLDLISPPALLVPPTLAAPANPAAIDGSCRATSTPVVLETDAPTPTVPEGPLAIGLPLVAAATAAAVALRRRSED